MTDDPGAGGLLNEEEKLFLHQVARRAVEAAACSQPAPDPVALAEEAGIDIQRRLADHRGVFVTLTQEGRLRGCIGYI